MRNKLQKSMKRQSGQGMTEYIILVIFIAVVAIAVVTIFGQQIRNWFGIATSELAQDPAGSGIVNVTGAEAKDAADKKVSELK